MKRVREILTCLILTCVIAQPVKADVMTTILEDCHVAVEAMHEVWVFETGELTEEASQEKLDFAIEKISRVKIHGIKMELEEMQKAAQALLDAKKAEEEAAAAEKRRQERLASASYYGNCKITHYCPGSCCCGVWAGGGTASGTTPTVGRTVANGGLPFGTHVLINGQEYIVEDRGVDGSTFDIFVGSHSEANNRGMYYTDVYILGG